MIKKFVVIEFEDEELTGMDNSDIATWIQGAMGQDADGDIDVTVYSSARDLFVEQKARSKSQLRRLQVQTKGA